MSTTEKPPATADDLVRAAELMIVAQLGSPRMLARKLQITGEEVEALLDELQLAGVVGAATDTGTRPLLVSSDELEVALRQVRAHAAKRRLVLESEALDEAHGGEVVLRGGLGLAEVHAAEVEVRPDGDVEVNEDADEPPHLVGRRVERPSAALATVAEAEPLPAWADELLGGLLALARIVWTTGQGFVSWGQRAYSAATYGNLREQIRLARARGDREQLRESELDLQDAKDKRTARLLKLPKKVAAMLGVVFLGGFLLLLLGCLVGLGFQLTTGGWGWSDWWGAIGAGLVFVGSVLWWIGYGSPWVGAPALLWAAFQEGGRRGTPMWLLKPEQRLLEGKEITPARVVLAMRDLGIAELRKRIEEAPDGGGWMISNIVPAGCGVEVDVALPSGISTDQIQSRRRKLAENMDRHEHEVFITIPPTPRTVRLWIADPGELDKPIGPSPLVTDPTLKADLQNGRAPWGQDLRGEPVGVSLYQRHMTITGLSNQGKTAALRSLALWAALDPNVDLHIADLKGVGDWDMFEGLAVEYIKGPTDDHVALATEMLERGVDEMERRMAAGKDARRRRDIYIVDEAQVAFMCPEKDEQRRPYGGTKANSRYFRACRKLNNQGRAVDEILWQGTQDPTDQNFPKLVREGAHIRASLVVGTEAQARMALGDKAVDQGAAPHLLRADLDKGTVVMHGGVQMPPGQSSITVRTHFNDDDEAAQIAQRAKDMRHGRRRPALEASPGPDHLRAIHRAMRGEKRVRTAVLLGRLIEDDADLYEPWGHQDLKAALAGDGGVDDPDVRIRKSDGQSTVFLEDVEEALARRDDDDE